MNRGLRSAYLAAALLASGLAPVAANEDEHLRALDALAYGESILAGLANMCAPNSQYAAMRMCTNRSRVPVSIVNRAALPRFQQLVPLWAAQAATRHYSSPQGQVLRRKLIQATKTNDPSIFSGGETAELDRFNKSPEGQALRIFSTDKEASQIVLRAIAAYEP